MPPSLRKAAAGDGSSLLGTGGQEIDYSMNGDDLVDSVSIGSAAPLIHSTTTIKNDAAARIGLEDQIGPNRYGLNIN
jgi:hypothetical protein